MTTFSSLEIIKQVGSKAIQHGTFLVYDLCGGSGAMLTQSKHPDLKFNFMLTNLPYETSWNQETENLLKEIVE